MVDRTVLGEGAGEGADVVVEEEMVGGSEGGSVVVVDV